MKKVIFSFVMRHEVDTGYTIEAISRFMAEKYPNAFVIGGEVVDLTDEERLMIKSYIADRKKQRKLKETE